MQTPELALWTSDFGREYTDRNDRERPERVGAWRRLLEGIAPARVLEVGCNVGWNLEYLRRLGVPALYGIEPQPGAVARARARGPAFGVLQGTAFDLPFRDGWFDLVFTSGVLIHIAPGTLGAAQDELHRVARRWIAAIEYDHPTEQEIEYRGRAGALWKRDHGALWQARFPGLSLVRRLALGPADGYDDCTAHLFEKVGGAVTAVVAAEGSGAVRAAGAAPGPVVAIVQARVGSTRLPGKVLADIAGDTMLARVVQRVSAAARVERVVVATSTAEGDAAVVREAARLGVHCFRGSEQDVLDRYLGAARAHGAGAVVRVTADCPLLDPEVIDDVIEALTPDVDYASNTHGRTFPQGLDAEALHRDTLERIARLATSAPAREHVTAFLREEPHLFRVRQVLALQHDADLRFTVDTAEDLALVRELYERLGLAHRLRPYGEVVEAVRAHPALRAINAHVVQRSWSHHGG